MFITIYTLFCILSDVCITIMYNYAFCKWWNETNKILRLQSERVILWHCYRRGPPYLIWRFYQRDKDKRNGWKSERVNEKETANQTRRDVLALLSLLFFFLLYLFFSPYCIYFYYYCNFFLYSRTYTKWYGWKCTFWIYIFFINWSPTFT